MQNKQTIRSQKYSLLLHFTATLFHRIQKQQGCRRQPEKLKTFPENTCWLADGREGEIRQSWDSHEAAGHCLMNFIKSGGLDFISLHRHGRYNSPEQHSTFYTVVGLRDCQSVAWALPWYEFQWRKGNNKAQSWKAVSLTCFSISLLETFITSPAPLTSSHP